MSAEWEAVEVDENDLTCDCSSRDMHEGLHAVGGLVYGLIFTLLGAALLVGVAAVAWAVATS